MRGETNLHLLCSERLVRVAVSEMNREVGELPSWQERQDG